MRSRRTYPGASAAPPEAGGEGGTTRSGRKLFPLPLREGWRTCSPGWVLLLLLLTGCGDDRPASGPPPQPSPAAQPAAASASFPAASDASSDSSSDPLLSGADRIDSDPLLSSDPLQGRAMPTQHSHWLRGHLHSAHVTVLLNSARLGTYYGLVDKDITMRLRKGVNSVTFIYQPGDAGSSAQMQVLESEHNPPIPPLVVFHSPPASDDGKPQSLTQTFRFIAN